MKFLITFFFLVSCCAGYSQNNIALTYCSRNDIIASRYQPSQLDLGYKKVQIGANYYSWLGNNAFDYGTIRDINNSGNIDDNDINVLLSKVKHINVIGIGQDYQILGAGFQVKTKNGNKLDFAVGIEGKFGVNVLFTDKLLKLALKGNKQYAGQTVELGPAALNMNYRREYVVSSAFNIRNSDKFSIRAGVRAKYILGLASVYMPKGNATITTEQNGKFIDATFDYNLMSSGLKNFSLNNHTGTGYGMDAGLTFSFAKRFEVVASILDIGNIYYSKNTKAYYKNASVHYDGLAVNKLFGNKNFSDDTIFDVLSPDVAEGRSYRMPLDTKLRIEGVYKTIKTDSKDKEYVSNTIIVTYIQGFNNMPGAITRPFFSLGYNHDFNNFFDGGALVSWGGYNRLGTGAFFFLRVAHTLKWGLSSDNLIAFINSGYGTGFDISSNVSITF